MKKYRMVIWGMLVFLGMTSCDKYLDVTPKNVISMDDMESIKQSLASFLRNIRDDGWSSLPSSPFQGNTYGIVAYTEEWDLSQLAENDFTDDEKRICDWRNESNQSLWGKYYSPIGFLNLIIHEAKTAEGDKTMRDYVMGEAYAMRAYIHFMLVNLYGKPYNEENLNTKAVPLKLNSNTEDAPSRNTVAEIYAAIESDIVEAGKRLNVEKWDVGFNYRFTTTALKAFRSRLYLYMQKWSESLNASKEVLEINKELVDLSQTTMPNNYQSVESIMALEYSSADINRAIYISTDLYNLYNSNDYRRRNRFYTSEGSGRYTVRKGGSNEYACTFRTGEIYLNAAEAACQDDNLIDAKDYLLQLKAKRFNATGYAEEETKVEAMDKDELLQEIYDERYRELAFEGHRWFDLRRTTQPAITKTENETEYKLEQGDERYTIRIPNEAIQSNPNLTN